MHNSINSAAGAQQSAIDVQYGQPSSSYNDRITTPMVTICSAVADLDGGSAEYYLVRWFDSKDRCGSRAGSGWALFSLTEAAAILNKSPLTIRKNLYKCHHNGFFWSVKVTSDQVLVRYKSEARIAAEQGIEQLGASARIPISRLQHIKIAATETQTESTQRASIWAAKKHTKQEKRQITPVAKLFPTDKQKQCQNWGAETNVIYQGPRCTFTNSNYVSYGVSQETIAFKMDRSERTIRARLSRQAHEQIGVPIKRTQIARKLTNEYPQNWTEEAYELSAEGDRNGGMQLIRNYNFGKAVFKLMCNVYQLPIELVRQRWKKKQLNQLLRQSKISESSSSISSKGLDGKNQSTKAKTVTDNSASSDLGSSESSEPMLEGRSSIVAASRDNSDSASDQFDPVDPKIPTGQIKESIHQAIQLTDDEDINGDRFKPGDRVVVHCPGTNIDRKLTQVRGRKRDNCGRWCYRLDLKLAGCYHILPASMLEPALPFEEPRLKHQSKSQFVMEVEVVELSDAQIKALPIPQNHWLRALSGQNHRIRREEVEESIWHKLIGVVGVA